MTDLFIELLNEKRFRVPAAHALEFCGSFGDQAVPRLVELMQGEEKNEAAFCRQALTLLRRQLSKEILPDLLALADDPAFPLRQEALGTASYFWGGSPRRDRLAEDLNHPDWRVRRLCAAQLRLIPDLPTNIVSALTKRLTDERIEVRQASALALAWIDPQIPGVIEIISQGIRNQDEPREARSELVLALGFSRRRLDQPAPVIDTLAWALTDPDPCIRIRSSQALGFFGPDAQPAIDSLVQVLDDDRPHPRAQLPAFVCSSSASTLGQIGPVAKQAVPKLRRLLDHHEGAIRQQAAIALWKICGDKDRALKVLLERLSDVTPSMNWDVVTTLGEMGPAAAEALPQLRQLALADHGNLSKLAREVILQIDSASAR